jgi:murein DD-endopeptidase MepM/ murein hydrolase activator NlpD
LPKPSLPRSFAALAGAAALLCAAPGGAAAQVGGAAASPAGGAMATERPVVQTLTCAEGRTARCGTGQVLKVRGSALSDVSVVYFRGGKGAADDRTATPSEQSPRRLLVQVPDGARSGKVQVRSTNAGVSRSGPTLKIPALPVLRTPASLLGLPAVFPIVGKHEFGALAVQRFGGARGHQGQDTFAACGTPLVAAHGGVVQYAGAESRAGNYIVIHLPDGTSEVYMHMAEPTPLKADDPVAAGQPIGFVGDTGRADGCHLHFELWTTPGWYEGGEPVDPWDWLHALPGA